MTDYIDRLRDAIRRLHGCESEHVESVPVKENFRGQTVWDGTVEVFRLTGHPHAKQCFAWSHDENGAERFVAVLGIPPIDAALAAVRAAIVAESKRRIGF
jgi:hypothetical protein